MKKNRLLPPLFLILTAAALHVVQMSAGIQTDAEIRRELLATNTAMAKKVALFYQSHADRMVRLAHDKNTRDAFVQFDRALDQFNPDISADVEGLRGYYEEKMLPWILNQKRRESVVGPIS